MHLENYIGFDLQQYLQLAQLHQQAAHGSCGCIQGVAVKLGEVQTSQDLNTLIPQTDFAQPQLLQGCGKAGEIKVSLTEIVPHLITESFKVT